MTALCILGWLVAVVQTARLAYAVRVMRETAKRMRQTGKEDDRGQ